MNARALNIQQSLIFFHGEEESFVIKAKYDLESDFADLLAEVRVALEPVFSKLPADWVDRLFRNKDRRAFITQYCKHIR